MELLLLLVFTRKLLAVNSSRGDQRLSQDKLTISVSEAEPRGLRLVTKSTDQGKTVQA